VLVWGECSDSPSTADAGRVQVIVDIDSSTPISDKTLGGAAVAGGDGAAVHRPAADQAELSRTVRCARIEYPVIRSARSRFDVFLNRLPDVLASAGELIDKAARALSDQNINAITHALANIDKASEGLPKTLRDVNELVGELRGGDGTGGLRQGARQIVDQAGPEVVGIAAAGARYR